MNISIHMEEGGYHWSLLGSKLMFSKRDKHYSSRSGQTSLATAVRNFTKPVTKNNFGPSKVVPQSCEGGCVLDGVVGQD